MGFIRDQSAGYLANHMARLFARELQARIKPLGLSIGTFPALLVLWEGDGLTQRELIERLDIEQPTMANTLARMERDGLVVRRKDAADGRVQRIWLTAAARALEAAATAAADEVNDRALAVLSPGERASFVDAMCRIIAALQTGVPDDAAGRSP
ncbi:MarR family winged helix-turn-helix transcriptional regulator [Thiococcus pfennigii]|jgi:DNA-binding MarR family transcriptional regulator|uniref:MarR family winged helix-turn-helix transcriptional regulator n=1 Tax=Thiococcus pfennigii TaxID=1057 RepID=UPI0019072E96|nr:MarR family winged helix-turn-helix transcriptional regulator [Thiococcus pfennigii]MBK1701975.1 MarR family transcriptional regulator [Thiococcus pfennigii]MBK1732977.1 MarR family transcriptional regulator [Thiococcus pfennigii]